jgi:cytochrome c peroxidase
MLVLIAPSRGELERVQGRAATARSLTPGLKRRARRTDRALWRSAMRRRSTARFGGALGLLLTLGVASASLATRGGDPAADVRRALEGYRKPAAVPHPADNATSPLRVELGRALFFDPRLSRSGITSCATCHNPSLEWGDGLALGVGAGMKQLKRRTPTILNVAWAELLFWDGRAETLEEQALGPIQSPDEMNMDLHDMVQAVGGIHGYRALFAEAYPGEGVTKETVAKALAVFERTVISPQAPFDRWVDGDESALSAAAKRGFQLFDGKANCSACHAGWRFTDDSFHDVGVRGDDLGRGALFEETPLLQHAFKTPTLRNVERRAPYMHNGSEASLALVIELYDRGGRVHRASLSEEIRPLKLTQAERSDLLAFLTSLTSVSAPTPVPVLPR